MLFTNLGGECQFASIVAEKLESLGALTQGYRRAGPSLGAYNYDSVYGKRALHMMYKAIIEQSDQPVLPPNFLVGDREKIQEFHSSTRTALISAGIIRDAIPEGIGKDTGKLSGRILENDMNDVGRFLNCILGLAPDIQNRIFEYFISILVQDARKEGDFD